MGHMTLIPVAGHDLYLTAGSASKKMLAPVSRAMKNQEQDGKKGKDDGKTAARPMASLSFSDKSGVSCRNQ